MFLGLWRNWKFGTLLAGMQNGTSVLENSLTISYIAKHLHSITQQFLSIYLPEKKYMSSQNFYANVHNIFISNSLTVEIIQRSMNR